MKAKALAGLIALLGMAEVARADTIVHTSQAEFSSGTYAGWGAGVGSGGDVRLGLAGAETMGWSTNTAASLPAVRYGHAMSVWNGRLYVAGGNSVGAAQATVWSAPINADGSAGAWVTENSLPAPRQYPAMSVWNGRLYVTGGHDGGAAQSTVWSAPITANGSVGTWTTETNALPAARYAHAMSVWNGRLYVTGGWGGGAVQATVWSAPINADGSVGAWTTETNALPAARYQHVMSACNGRLYVAGGYDSAPQSTVWSAPVNADGSVGAWTTEANALPGIRYGHAMSVWNGRLYVTGGDNSPVQSTVWSASITANGSVGTWTTETNALPAARFNHAMSVWNGRLYVTGGHDGAATQSTVWSAPINAEGSVGSAWTTETNALPAIRFTHAMSAWNGRLYVTGGYDGVTAQSIIWSASITANGSAGTWTTEANSLPAARYQHAMSVWNGRLYVTGGGNAGAQSTVWSAPITANGSIGTWITETNTLPAARNGHDMSAWNGRLYMTGGADIGGAHQSTVWSAPINADGSVGVWTTETNALPAPRYEHAMSVWNGRLYVTGGADAGSVPQSTVWSASINADGSVGTWTAETNSLPAARQYPAMSAWNGRLYVAGGYNGGTAQSTIWSASINADGSVGTWTTETNALPAARYGHAMSLWNGRLYVTGGYDVAYQSTVWSSNPPFYSSTGTYYSALVDLGAGKKLQSLSWTQSASPAGSSVQVAIATSSVNNPTTWVWTPVSNGGAINVQTRYLQYRVSMSPGGTVGSPPRDQTPVIDDVTITSIDDAPPALSIASVEGDASPPYRDETNNGTTSIVVNGESAMTCRWWDTDTAYSDASGTLCSVSGSQATCAVNNASGGGAAYTRHVACKDSSGNGNSAADNLGVTWTNDGAGQMLLLFE